MCGRAIKPVRLPSGTKAFIGHFSFVIIRHLSFSLAGYTQVTDLRNIGREGIDQRTVRLGLRLGF